MGCGAGIKRKKRRIRMEDFISMSDQNSKLEKIKKIKGGSGIQNLLNEAYQIFGNPLVMFNTEYNLLAYTNDIGDDPILNEIVATGTFSFESQKFFMEEGFGDAVANAKTVTFLISKKLKYDRIYGKLFSKNNIHVANLIILESNKTFEEEDLAAFEIFCELLSREIIKSEFYQTYGKIFQETYIRKLIDGDIKEKGIYTAHISVIYNGLKTNLHLAVADITKCDPGYTRLCYFRDLFRQLQPGCRYAIYNNYIVFIINTDTELNIKKDLKKLIKIIEENNIYVGISKCFENLFQLRQYYLEAVDALNNGLKTDEDQRIFLFDENKQSQ